MTIADPLALALSLVQQYVLDCDSADALAVTDLFWGDGTVVSNGTSYAGASAVRAFYLSRLRPGGVHLSLPTSIHIEGSTTVQARTHFLALRQVTDGSVCLPGTWTDEIGIVSGSARFRSRVITTGRAVNLGESGVDVLAQLCEARDKFVR